MCVRGALLARLEGRGHGVPGLARSGLDRRRISVSRCPPQQTSAGLLILFAQTPGLAPLLWAQPAPGGVRDAAWDRSDRMSDRLRGLLAMR
jgi:hypothetical protein